MCLLCPLVVVDIVFIIIMYELFVNFLLATADILCRIPVGLILATQSNDGTSGTFM